MNLPEELLHNPHFVRYYRTWEENPVSIVFIPLAQICRERGLLDEAREICEKGLESHPNSVSGRILLARILFDMDQPEEARRIVEEILAELPAQREAKSLLDRIIRCQGDSGARPDKTSLWENLTMAKIYADQGEKAIAMRIVQKCMERNPGDPRALQLQEELKR